MLSGKRDIPESFFIEALTGMSRPLNTAAYLGIESVWNNKNYWVNMQDCSQGIQVSCQLLKGLGMFGRPQPAPNELITSRRSFTTSLMTMTFSNLANYSFNACFHANVLERSC